MRKLALKSEALADLAADELLLVGGGDYPTETKVHTLCVFVLTRDGACESVFQPCFSTNWTCTR